MTLSWQVAETAKVNDLQQRLDDLRLHYLQRCRELDIANERLRAEYERGRDDERLEWEMKGK